MSDFSNILQAVISKNKTSKTERRIIVCKDRRSYLACNKHLQRLGIQPLKRLKMIHSFSCHVHQNVDLISLEQHPLIKRIEPDIKVKLHAETTATNWKQRIPWGVRRVLAPQAWSVTQGQSVKVAVIDTGISKHPDLRIVRSITTMKGKSIHDFNGHGTHVAGTLAALNNRIGVVGVAPKLKLYSVKAFDKNGSAYLSDIIQGVEWCIRNGIQVINMSFGSGETSPSLIDIIRKAYGRGIVMVASAGNSGTKTDRIDYPARLPETIAVAATTRQNGIAQFSSRGPGVDIAAPGVNILSTFPVRTYKSLSGTSMAAPHVTGAVALLLSAKPKLSPGAVKKLLQSNAIHLPGYGDNVQGAGLLRIFFQ